MVEALSYAEQLFIRKVKLRDTAASTTFQDSSSGSQANASFQVSFECSSENDSVSAASSISLETRALELEPGFFKGAEALFETQVEVEPVV